MKRSLWIVIGAVVLVSGFGLWWRSRGKTEAPKFRTAVVERGAIQSVVSATGTIRPVVQVEVGSQVSGTVSKLLADFNSRVTAGQVLCQIEPSSFRARAAQAEAAVARADAALKEARRKHRRSQELVKENYVSQAEVEAAEVEVDQRAADLKQATAQLQAADVDLANTTIRAPIDGVVIARSIDVGQTVAASLQAPKLFVIANDLAQMQVETRIDEADIGRIAPGLPVTFTVDAFPDLPFRGAVTQVRLEPIVEQGVVTYTTVIRTQNRDLRLRPGMTANVTVMVAEKSDVLKVPSAALRFRPPVPGARGRGGASAGPTAVGRPGGAAGATAGPGGGAREGDARARDGAAPVAMRPGDANAAPPEAGADARSGAAAGTNDAGRERPGNGAGHGGVRGDGGAAGPGGMSMRGAPGGGARGAARGDGGAGMRGAPGGGGRAAMGSGAGNEPPGSPSPGDPSALKPGTVYVLRGDKPVRVAVMTGIGDGAAFEVESDDLKPGDSVIVGLEVATQNANLQPPPGMGGPRFGPPGGGRRGR